MTPYNETAAAYADEEAHLHERAHVLVAGQNQLLCTQLTSGLRADGHQVSEVQSGLQILEHLGPRPPGISRIRVLVLDISQNPWVGIALLKAVFCEDWAMPVILITSESSRVLAAVEELGVSAVLKKPFKVGALRKIVAELLAQDRTRGGGQA